MKNVFIYSWNEHSEGARDLAHALDIKRIKHQHSRFIQSFDKIVINWGSSVFPYPGTSRVQFINDPHQVYVASNKLLFFNRVNEWCRTVPWTTRQDVAQEWSLKSSVVVRNLLTSSSGKGIMVVPPGGQVPEAPLYTRYIPKDAEFRVHFVDGELIDVQRKIRNPDQEPTNWKIRSHSNGFIFVRGGFEVPDDVIEQSFLAFEASELDFGAIDVIWSEKKQQAFIVELNSAPGIQNTTVVRYQEALLKLIEKRRETRL